MENVKILVTGDFYGGSGNGSRIGNLIDNGRFEEIFGRFRNVIQPNDIAITNLESPVIISGKGIDKTGPVIKASPASLEALKYAGFNLVTLSNNHILDYGLEGLDETIDHLDKASLDHVGASTDSAQARKPYIKEVHGRKIAVLNFSENEWSTAVTEKSGANPLNPITNHYDIKEAAATADFVVVVLHGGNEYYDLPNPRTKEVCRFFADSGADMVVCHHAHCYSGFEDYNKSRIYYGLGNFVFDTSAKKDASWYYGIAVQAELTATGVQHRLIPYRQCKTEPLVEELDGAELVEFDQNIARLNNIIQDDEQMKKSYEKFIARKRSVYDAFLQPYDGKFRSLYKKKLLPPILKDKYFRLLLNLIRCESHRDVIVKLLLDKNRIDHKS